MSVIQVSPMQSGVADSQIDSKIRFNKIRFNAVNYIFIFKLFLMPFESWTEYREY